jgi:predicted ribonuclease toxin of YeeF-YezG toxin-antitoxin module
VSSKTRSKDYYDKKAESPNLSEGDKALLYDETVRRGRSKKLSSQWIGPYEVVAVDKVSERYH